MIVSKTGRNELLGINLKVVIEDEGDGKLNTDHYTKIRVSIFSEKNITGKKYNNGFTSQNSMNTVTPYDDKIFEERYSISNNEDKYEEALNKAILDCEQKILVDVAAKNKFELLK